MTKRATRSHSEVPEREGARGMLGLAKGALIWERLWPRVWPLVAVTLIFLSMALFDVLPQLPVWLHWAVLFGFTIGFLVLLRRLLLADLRFNIYQTQARLERDSGLDHRPLRSQSDRVINEDNDPLTNDLWRAHQRRLQNSVSVLRLNMPSPGMAANDPFALRMVLILVVALALTIGWTDSSDRIARAFWPQPSSALVAEQKFDVWITPPPYTGLAPVFFGSSVVQGVGAEENRPNKTIPKVPVGSIILAEVSGFDEGPEIRLTKRGVRLEPINSDKRSGGFRGEIEVLNDDLGSTSLAIVSNQNTISEWNVLIVADKPPVTEFIDAPKKVGQASLALRFEARDDFALKDMWATVSKENSEEEIRIDLPAIGIGTPLGKGTSRHDYSAHPWAGTTVQLRLFAEDAKGQVGKGDGFEMILPERVFNHPVARALVEQRKKLNAPKIRAIAEVVIALNLINSNPARYFHDTVVFLNIAVARARLSNDRSPGSITSVQKQLWETALRIEDGEFAIADRDLREIQEQLAKAMRDGAPAQELQRLMAELQAALDKYMSALAEHLQRQGMDELPTSPSARAMESGDLQKMIERARDLANIGDMEAAREMLAQLNQALNNIRDGARMAPQNKQMENARKMMDELRNLSKRQQQLLDQTFRQSQENQQQGSESLPQIGKRDPNSRDGMNEKAGASPDGKPNSLSKAMKGLAKDQQSLRRDLGKMMLDMDKILGAIPGGIGEAERAMKGAGKALGQGDASGALPEQTKALDKLRQGTNQAAEQMARQMQGQGQLGLAPGQNGRRPGEGRDPFGRSGGGAHGEVADDGNIKMPSERDILRTRGIIKELRRRAGEQSRPQIERDYIDRLLRRF
jgi:uncharacterized protein (TIGR02302 family)